MKQLIYIAFCSFALPVLADTPEIKSITAFRTAAGWRFDVTVSHPDSGWDHYADGWRVLDMDGHKIGMRVLSHPHVAEQPFTRSLGAVHIPLGTMQVQIETRCIVDGWSGAPVTVTLN